MNISSNSTHCIDTKPQFSQLGAAWREALRLTGIWFVTVITLIMARLVSWQQRDTQRRHLAILDDRLLADMGISRDAAARKSGKPFWRG